MKVYCPYCHEEEEYKIEKREIKYFKKVLINSYENVAVCKKCNNDLFVNKLEDENLKRINNMYITKIDGILPEDIIKFRKKFDISQRELTSILEFGKMTLNRYENGMIPSKSQSDYLKLIINNEEEFVKKVNDAYKKNNITKKTYNKIINYTNNKKCEDEEEYNIQKIYRTFINGTLKKNPDIYNGYTMFDLEKVENIISYIASKVDNLTLTSLNKYLWFIDMVSFNKRCVSITGITYQNQQYGPTIIDNKFNEFSLLEDKYKKCEIEDDFGTRIIIKSNNNYDISKCSENEIEIIDKVIEVLKNKKVTEISNLSHDELAWKKTKKYEKISFEYATDLKIKVN